VSPPRPDPSIPLDCHQLRGQRTAEFRRGHAEITNREVSRGFWPDTGFLRGVTGGRNERESTVGAWPAAATGGAPGPAEEADRRAKGRAAAIWSAAGRRDSAYSGRRGTGAGGRDAGTGRSGLPRCSRDGNRSRNARRGGGSGGFGTTVTGSVAIGRAASGSTAIDSTPIGPAAGSRDPSPAGGPRRPPACSGSLDTA
jgi:hypothetical protein